jgi:serine/threonine-protein kinase
MKVTVNSANATAAQVTVQSTLVQVPNVVGQTYAAAVSAITTAGFAVAQKSFVDNTCNDVGMVISQSPAGGTPLAVGSTITITVAIAPKHPCP